LEQPQKALSGNKAGWLQDKRTILTTILAMVVMYVLALRTGAASVLFGYVWADTCWLLKLGQLIFEKAAIPQADLFSFTLPLCAQQGNPQPYVVYQWLAELIFYCLYGWFKAAGLLVAVALIMTLAFLTIPFRWCIRSNAPIAWSLLAVGAASLSANVRCIVRPEIFTFLNLAICLALLQPQRDRVLLDIDSRNHIDWKFVGALTFLIIAWSNLHSGFVTGIILVAIYALSFSLEDLIAKRTLSGATKSLLLGLVCACIGSLINPYGIGLWLYLPHLFFMPINAQIDECKPLIGLDLNRAIYFIVTTVLCCGASALAFHRIWKSDRQALKSPVRQSSLFIVLVATAMGFWMRRLTPIAALIMVFETASYIGDKTKIRGWLSSFWTKRRSCLIFELVMLILAGQGVAALAGKAVPVNIPSYTKEFSPPFSAIGFFMKTYSHGRIFSSLPISDMLDMYWGPHAALFIDSRMDAYSEEIIDHYLTILYAKRGWRELLDQLQIEWVFLSPDKPVCQLLEHEPGWDIVYKDSTARILRRR
jgi:hypothetical protein